MEITPVLESAEVARAFAFRDDTCGLRGYLVLDDLTLGPAAGGIRTCAYHSDDDALADVQRLARAMTLKCSISGLDAGGGKAVVLCGEDLDRPTAFTRLGELVEDLGGAFYTAGDLGTTGADLATMAAQTRYVRTDEVDLAAAVGRGLVHCIDAVATRRGRTLAGLRVAVQGCGAIGGAAARALAAAGVELLLADMNPARSAALADELGATAAHARDILMAEVDIVAPCAVGAAFTEEVAAEVRAWAVCGGANNILASPEVGRVLAQRDILFVPDMISSAGAVIEGVGEGIMGLSDREPLIERLGQTTREVLDEAESSGRTPNEVAEQRARARIDAKRAGG